MGFVSRSHINPLNRLKGRADTQLERLDSVIRTLDPSARKTRLEEWSRDATHDAAKRLEMALTNLETKNEGKELSTSRLSLLKNAIDSLTTDVEGIDHNLRTMEEGAQKTWVTEISGSLKAIIAEFQIQITRLDALLPKENPSAIRHVGIAEAADAPAVAATLGDGAELPALVAHIPVIEPTTIETVGRCHVLLATGPTQVSESREVATILEELKGMGVEVDDAGNLGHEKPALRPTAAVETGLQRIRRALHNRPIEAMETRPWTLAELRLLRDGVKVMSPAIRIAAKARSSTGPVVIFGRTNMSHADAIGAIRDRPAQIFGLSFRKKIPDTTPDRTNIYDTYQRVQPSWAGDPGKEFLGTIVHELSHHVVEMALTPTERLALIELYDAAKSEADGHEAFITEYSQASLVEDLAESIKFCILDPSEMESRCPKRFAVLQGVLARLGIEV